MEGSRSLEALDENIDTFQEIYGKIKEYWTQYNTVLAFAPDHGCHRNLLFLGSHGTDKSSDMETVHFYSFIPRDRRQSKTEVLHKKE